MRNNDIRGLIPVTSKKKKTRATGGAILPLEPKKQPLSGKLYLVMSLTQSAKLNVGSSIDLAWLAGQVGAVPVFADYDAAVAASCGGEYPVVEIEVAPK